MRSQEEPETIFALISVHDVDDDIELVASGGYEPSQVPTGESALSGPRSLSLGISGIGNASNASFGFVLSSRNKHKLEPISNCGLASFCRFSWQRATSTDSVTGELKVCNFIHLDTAVDIGQMVRFDLDSLIVT